MKIAVDAVDRNFLTIAPFLLVAVIIDAIFLAPFFGDGGCSEYFLPVGEGDSELIVTKTGAKILIDGGPANSLALESLDKIIAPSDRYLDLVVMTHAQLDHFGGLMDVIKSYRIGMFVWNGVENATETFKNLKRSMAERGVASIALKEGDRVTIGDTAMEILSPSAALLAGGDLNDSALIIEVDAGDIRSLFMSDVSSRVEEEIVRGIGGAINVLKVAHHGSKGASSGKFLRALSPDIAIIEVGENSYGHPAEEVINRLAAIGAKIVRTDETGIVKISGTATENIGVFAMK